MKQKGITTTTRFRASTCRKCSWKVCRYYSSVCWLFTELCEFKSGAKIASYYSRSLLLGYSAISIFGAIRSIDGEKKDKK